MEETPDQRTERDAGNRQGKCVRAHLTRLVYGLEVLIGWEPHARVHARMYSLSRTFYYEVADACGL